MPAIGANGQIQRGARLPSAPSIPTPKASTTTGTNPRGVAISRPIPLTPTAPATVGDRASRTLSTGANPRGTSILHATTPPLYQKSPGYQQAVINVFKHQSPAQQKAVVQGALKNRTFEGNLILKYVQRIGSGPSGGVNLAAITPKIGLGTVGAIQNATAGLPSGFLKVVRNAASDAWSLPAGTVEGLYGLGQNIVTGHEGTAFHMLVDPYVQLAEHPIRTFEEHPVNTLLMASGLKSLAGRTAGAAAGASTARAPLSLGTVAGEKAPIMEARSYSPDLLTQAIQKSRESYLRGRGRNPDIAGPKPKYVHSAIAQAFNIGHEAKLNRIVDEMTAVRQMAGRGERAKALTELRKAAPHKDVRNITSHILQGVIRTPETAVEDISKEMNRLKAAQTGKRTVHEIMNRRQVRDLGSALQYSEKIPEAFQAADKIRGQIHAQDKYLVEHGLIDPQQAERRALLPYAMAHMGAHYDPVAEKFVAADGKPLQTADILQHLKENNVPEPAYVRHAPGPLNNPGDFYKAYRLARGGTDRGPLSGKLFQTGGYDSSFEGLAHQMASKAEDVTRASLHDKVVSRLGIRMPEELKADLLARTRDPKQRELINQGLMTKDEANKIARASVHEDYGNAVPGSLELVPIAVGSAKSLGLLKDLQDPNAMGHLSEIEQRALSNAIQEAQHSTTRNVVLVPRIATERFTSQFARTDSMLRSVGKVTQQFRRTVLPYSTHWMLQIGSEAGLRAFIAGALDPRYLRDGRQLMKRLKETEAGRAAGMETVNATFYNARDPLAVHNLNPGTISSIAHSFPPTRVIIAAHNRYANSFGHAMYTLEHNARLMGLGKLAHREVAEFSRSWKNGVMLQAKALDELAHRMETNPALVAKLGRQIDDMFGKYNKFTPKQRAAIQSIAPFLPWYLNAAKYVFWNLPVHHPVASALMASLRQTINQDIKDGKQAPLGTYAMQELARISPFGIFTPDSTTPSAAGLASGQQLVPGALLPEAQGALYNYAGSNSFGEGPLKSPSGHVKAKSPGALAAASESLLESFLPLARYVREVQEGGKPAYGTSTVLSPQPEQGKGQTSVANRILNPFYSFNRSKGSGPAYGSNDTAAPTSSGGGWGGSSSSSGGWG